MKATKMHFHIFLRLGEELQKLIKTWLNTTLYQEWIFYEELHFISELILA